MTLLTIAAAKVRRVLRRLRRTRDIENAPNLAAHDLAGGGITVYLDEVGDWTRLDDYITSTDLTLSERVAIEAGLTPYRAPTSAPDDGAGAVITGATIRPAQPAGFRGGALPPTPAFTMVDLVEALRPLREAFETVGHAAVPDPIPNIRFTTDEGDLRAAGAALARELGLDPDLIVADGMPLWFETIGTDGYTWHYLEYEFDDDGRHVLDGVDPVTASRSVVVSTEQVDRYYDAITIRETTSS